MYDIQRLAGEMALDHWSTFGPSGVRGRGDMPACCAFGFAARMGAERTVVGEWEGQAGM